MTWLKEQYQRNIYGVIGTLVFHIILVSVFILADIDMKGKIKEEAILFEFPEIIEEKIEEPISPPEEEMPNKPSDNSNKQNLITNRAANLNASNDDFFDEEYQKEIDKAKQLVSDVNAQLDKKTTDMADIKMPVESTEGLNPDSIKNIIYAGESNISYDLKGRHHISLPVPVYLAQGGGKVVVDIVVDQRGNVIKASARNGNSVSDSQIIFYSQLAASRTIFNSDGSAPARQKGTITYDFVAQ